MSDKSKKDSSKLQESSIANFLGWKVVSGSGSRFEPGDISSDNWLGECKTHVEGGHRIEFHKNVWEKIKIEAMSKFKMPVYFVDDGSQSLKHTWVMFKRVNFPYQTWVKTEVIENNKSITFNDSDYDGHDYLYPYRFQDDKVFICRLYTFSAVAELI